MSWWDASGFSNLASQALKNAQKKIDKVLDIDDDPNKGGKRKGSRNASKKEEKKEAETSSTEAETSGTEAETSGTEAEGDFWSTWMAPTKTKSDEASSEKSSAKPSSWSLPWGGFDMGIGEGDSGTKERPEESTLTPASESGPVSDKTKDSREELEEDSVPPTSSASLETDVGANVLDAEDAVQLDQADSVAELGPNVSSVVEGTSLDWNDSGNVSFSYTDTSPKSDGGNLVSSTLIVSDTGKQLTDVLKCIQTDESESLPQKQEEAPIHDSATFEEFDESCKEPTKMSAKNVDEVSPISESMPLSENNLNPQANNAPSEENLSTHLSDVKQNYESLEGLSNASQEHVGSTNLDEGLQNTLTSPDENDSANPQKQSDSTFEESTGHGNASDSSVTTSDISIINYINSGEGEKDAATDQGTQNISLDSSVQESGTSGSEDFYQDYVNVGNNNLTPQTESLDVSTFSSEELIQSGSDFDLAASRASSDLDIPAGHTSSTGSSETSRLDSSADTVVEKEGFTLGLQDQIEQPYSLFKSSTENSEIDADGYKSADSSFVKCMIEEAMEESGREDSGSDNHSNGSKSESSKIDSELEKSVHSGHDSSDDIETTTSSDIEIISAPMSGSESKFNTFDISPLKISLRTSSGDRRYCDSHSSSSTQSKGGDPERLSPERGDGHQWKDDEHHDQGTAQEDGVDNPYLPERLLKLSQDEIQKHLIGAQKLAEMAEVLQARETKLVLLSMENHQLMEDTSILRNQLKQSEEARESETADLKVLTDEFTIRIGESEKKLQATLKDKESLKQKLAARERELERRSQNTDLEAELEEKTQQVEELLIEGEKLSKQQLQNSNIIKKLRSKEKENDTTMTSNKKRLEEQKTELNRLTVVLDSKEEMEKKQTEAINQLNSAVQRQEQEYNKVVSDHEDMQEKNRGLQAALDNAYKEIAELHRSNASQGSKAQEAALSAETVVREELKFAMEREQQKFKQERAAFIMQADDLRLDMTKLEKEHSRREELLRDEITYLQERLQQDEARSQDLSNSVTHATRPLLRQIENLQATYGAQSLAWEKVEKNLTDRLAEAQTSLAMAQEKERTASEHQIEVSAKLASLQTSNARLKQEKAQLNADKESDKLQIEELQDVRNSAIAQLETSKRNLSQELTKLKMEKSQVDSQLVLEKNRLENEKKKSSALDEQIRLMEYEKSRETPSPSPSMSVSRQESMIGSSHERSSPGANWSFYDDGDSGSSVVAGTNKTSVYESLRQSGATVVLENLQSQLKLREGEIVQLQSEIAQLERTRESMAREIVDLSNKNEELKEKERLAEECEVKYNELNNRYGAILLMYGEKEEQVQELQLDLQDIKEMYKSQINALLDK